ncbi:DUF934 domain-containing protein [Acetobacter sp. TBRC 12305]|uniref:DUF934 domain-containing protein n=1 Tax=Acetobacter garciniae TaxID=2817435 RepID=A0A939HLA9_9PROT|nr:DUF934 domain-containing protein [Acetobacter garciniae]MBO1324156.1 DUF934 domain-containing protein [Acetobacter garciniae]MBX0343845.1 DUF934 domain-containing protein [Acetobacter garciniae]
MPLFEKGRIIEDSWQVAQDEQPLPDGDVLVPLSRLAEGLGRNDGGRLGVVLSVGDRVEDLATALPRLDLVCLTFPIFRDGRPFTQARALREHLHYKGVVRVDGHFLPDQYEFLLRCGADQVVIPEGSDPAVWQDAHTRFTIAYQPSLLDERPQGLGFRRWLSA